jgi:hypothetical protein
MRKGPLQGFYSGRVRETGKNKDECKVKMDREAKPLSFLRECAIHV